jgi:ATPase subunit of ABC transporter with duplicated ATPase domains
MTSHDREFMNRIIGKVVEIRRRLAHHIFGHLRFLQQRALAMAAPGAIDRQQAMLAARSSSSSA